jgi:hypothetical protein
MAAAEGAPCCASTYRGAPAWARGQLQHQKRCPAPPSAWLRPHGPNQPQLEFCAEEEPITIIPSFQLRHNPNGMLHCIGVRRRAHGRPGAAGRVQQLAPDAGAWA